MFQINPKTNFNHNLNPKPQPYPNPDLRVCVCVSLLWQKNKRHANISCKVVEAWIVRRRTRVQDPPLTRDRTVKQPQDMNKNSCNMRSVMGNGCVDMCV